LPSQVPAKGLYDRLTDAEVALRVCPCCGGPTRPHVLWFDETYNEVHYRFHSTLEAAATTGVRIIVGTNLPNQVALLAKSKGALVIDVNIEANVFSRLALAEPEGFFIQQAAVTALPVLVQALAGALGPE
jgi:NAD-dependent deacetylase